MSSCALPAGTILQGEARSYRIERALGQGSFGITYLATTQVRVDGPLGALETTIQVAVKEFFMKEINGRTGTSVTSGSSGGVYEDYRRKFAREARNLGRMKHPHIVRVLESFEANNTVYYAMEFCPGGSLDQRIEQQQGLPEAEALRHFGQIADALGYLHGERMLHLDLKPANIMLRTAEDVAIIDFGLSKQYNEQGVPESSTTIGGGTEGYAPIEQLQYREGRAFPVTMDVYALGATLYKMLTGRRAPNASDVLNDGFPADRLQQQGVSAHTIGCIARAMAPLKAQRYQTVAEFAAALLTPNEETAIPAAATPAEVKAPAEEETQFGPQERVATAVAKEEPTELDHEPKRPTPPVPPTPPAKPKPVDAPAPKSPAPKKKWGAWIVAACVLIGIAVGFLAFRSGSPTSTGPTEEELLAQQRQDSLERVRQQQRQDSIAQATADAERARLAAEQQKREEEQRKREEEERRKREEEQRRQEATAAAAAVQQHYQQQQQSNSAIDIPMVYVAGGTFTMGASAGDYEAEIDENPAHSVTVSSFYIGKYEVTQAQWKAVMGTNPSYFKGDNLPVENVSWNDVQEFIRKLNAQTGKTYRLPTEAEWEFAAKGGNSSQGYMYSGSNDIDSVAWNGSNSGSKTHPVGTKAPNELGIYDMTGNVLEWCSDWYGESYYSNSPSTNPKGPSSGSHCVLRGGSWNPYARFFRVSDRLNGNPDYRSYYYGFRLVLDAQ